MDVNLEKKKEPVRCLTWKENSNSTQIFIEKAAKTDYDEAKDNIVLINSIKKEY